MTSFLRWLLLLAVSATAQAMPVNGDFAAGFAGWSGEVENINGIVTPVDPPPGAFPDNFDASSGAAVLRTTAAGDGIFFVGLFQEFMVETLLPGETLILSLDLAVSIADPAEGLAFAQINHGPGFMDSIDLSAAAPVDITFLAGETVEVFFGILDFDDVADTLTVDNIVITRIPVALPTPPPAALLGLGLVGLAGIRRR